jgi:uncharacterized protein YbcI
VDQIREQTRRVIKEASEYMSKDALQQETILQLQGTLSEAEIRIARLEQEKKELEERRALEIESKVREITETAKKIKARQATGKRSKWDLLSAGRSSTHALPPSAV